MWQSTVVTGAWVSGCSETTQVGVLGVLARGEPRSVVHSSILRPALS
jgi:hypothetical protein